MEVSVTMEKFYLLVFVVSAKAYQAMKIIFLAFAQLKREVCRSRLESDIQIA